MPKYRNTWIAISLIISVLLAACTPRSTPPGADSISGVAAGARYTYHYWDEGLSLLFWFDFASGGGGCTGSGSTEDPVYRLACDEESLDGVRVTWVAETSDGVSADLWIEGRRYDPADGALFLITTRGDAVQIEQVARDLSQLRPEAAALEALAVEDPAVAVFVAGLDGDGG